VELDLPACWRAQLASELASPAFLALSEFVDQERARERVFPAPADVFRAFRATPFEAVRVVLLGQDPYHGAGQAQGLCFSVPQGVPTPPSLRNMFSELVSDLGVAPPSTTDLSAWSERGVLLLNTVLTVREGQAGSHQKRGWERLTDAAIRALSARARPCVFALWGKPAQQKRALIDEQRMRVVCAAHPSPLSAWRGFLGAKPYSAIQTALAELNLGELDFTLL
jgi:uracil-DNA glycosylase